MQKYANNDTRFADFIQGAQLGEPLRDLVLVNNLFLKVSSRVAASSSATAPTPFPSPARTRPRFEKTLERSKEVALKKEEVRGGFALCLQVRLVALSVSCSRLVSSPPFGPRPGNVYLLRSERQKEACPSRVNRTNRVNRRPRAAGRSRSFSLSQSFHSSSAVRCDDFADERVSGRCAGLCQSTS